MRASAIGTGQSPSDSLAADTNDAVAGTGGCLAPRGVKSPLDSSEVKSAMKARTAATAADKSPLADRLAVLPTLDLADLRQEWRRLFRAEPPRLGRDIMMRSIAYRIQEIAQGGLSKVTQRRLTTLAGQLETDGRITALPGPRIKPGSRLIREWHGRTHTVSVIDEGFEYQGKAYRSLTQIASDITGAKWSGPRWLDAKAEARRGR
jgi:Protein of unknown function (DUF2924)